MIALDRPRLISELEAARDAGQRLLLLCAPSGYAKTPAVREWLGNRDGATAWFRCAPDQDASFWTRLGATVAATSGQSLDEFASPQEQARQLFETLPDPLTLVIDDYQYATSIEHDLGLAEAVADAEHLTLVVIARRVTILDGPLVTSRVPMRVFDAQDLALTEAEVAALLRNIAATDTPELRRALERADGWPRAVLTAVSSGDPLAELNRLALHHLELTSEVARRILLAASTVDAISLDHAADFVGTDIPTARAAMHELIELGIMIPVATEDTTEFRCHPALKSAFATRSERSFTAEQKQQLITRRAELIEHSAPLTAYAMQLAAGSYAAAELTLARNLTLITDAVETARGLRALPETTLEEHPLFAAARLAIEYGDPNTADSTIAQLLEHLDRGVRILAESDTRELQTAAIAFSMLSARLQGRLDDAVIAADALATHLAADRHLELAAKPQPTAQHSPGALFLYLRETAMTWLEAGELKRARRAWQQLADHASQLPDTVAAGTDGATVRGTHAARARHRWRRTALGGQALTALCDGDIAMSAALLAAYDALGERTSSDTSAADWVLPEIARAHIAYERADESLPQITAERLSQVPHTAEIWPLIVIANAEMVRITRGADWSLSVLQAAQSDPLIHHTNWAGTLDRYRAEVTTSLGRFAEAEELLESLPDDAATRIDRARVELFSGNDTQALLTVQSVSEEALSTRHRVDHALLSAVAAWNLGQVREAERSLRAAAAAVALSELVSPLRNLPYDQLVTLTESLTAEARETEPLASFAAAVAAVPVPARSQRFERLTAMEQRTLTAIAAHRNINDTAEALFISPATVKKHLKAVYRKLRVGSRDDAILQATRMGLLAA